MKTIELYDSHDALGLAELVAQGEIRPADLLDEALRRIDSANPRINAVAILQENVARKAAENGQFKGKPFGGVPFFLKDLGAEAVDYPANNGSVLLKGTRYKRNAAIVDRLLDAGLVVIGRTTSPEGGIGPSTEATVYGGPTRNPWDLGRSSGGSSGGSAAAVCAGIVPAAHGSDGGGSVRIPASACGLFGFKPTRARLPDGPDAGEGWAGMATDGFLTRSVRDTAALLDATAGHDLGAPYRAPLMKGTFLASTRRKPSSLRIALFRGTLAGKQIHPECVAAVDAAARLLQDLGHHVEEKDSLPADHEGMMDAWTKIIACGTALWVRNATRRSGAELREGDVEGVVRGACEYALRLSGADYLESVNKVHAYGREMEAFFADGADIALSATLAEPPAKIGRFAHVNEDFVDYRRGPEGVFSYSPFTACFNASGQPAASVPLHWTDDGLPVGVHLAAPFGEDELLMSLCAQIEEERPWKNRRPPAFSAND